MTSDHTNPAEGDASAHDPAAPAPQGAEQRARLVSRRALVRAGWTVPVVLALHLPTNAVAQYGCTHTDVPATAHEDVTVIVDGVDVHTDTTGTAHVDADVCA